MSGTDGGQTSGSSAQASSGAFMPNEEHMKVLLQLGISKNAATKALFYTGNFSADLAAAWVFENEGDPTLNDAITTDHTTDHTSSDEDVDTEDFLDEGAFHKMVFVVNMELKMGVGKLAAQVGHAAVGLYREMCENQQTYGETLSQWEQFGETKIVLKGQTAQQLEELQAKAGLLQLATYLVQDAGRTQIAAGSKTVLGVIGQNSKVDQVTGKLSLL